MHCIQTPLQRFDGAAAFNHERPRKVAPSAPSRVAATKAFLEQKFHLPINVLLKGWETQGGVMTTLQAMCLGAMLAWTPSLVVLALVLREAPLDELERDPS